MKNTPVSARVLWVLALVMVLLFATVSLAFALTNLITDGDFPSKGSFDANWLPQPDTDLGAWDNTTGNLALGSAMLDAASGGSGQSGIYQCVAIPVGMSAVYLSGFIYAGANADASIGVYEYIDASCTTLNPNSPTAIIDLHSSHQSIWEPVETTIGSNQGIVLDSGTTHLKILLNVFDTIGGGATAWFDDVTTASAGPNAVILNSFDAKRPAELSTIWPVLIAFVLALGAGALVLRRRRA